MDTEIGANTNEIAILLQEAQYVNTRLQNLMADETLLTKTEKYFPTTSKMNNKLYEKNSVLVMKLTNMLMGSPLPQERKTLIDSNQLSPTSSASMITQHFNPPRVNNLTLAYQKASFEFHKRNNTLRTDVSFLTKRKLSCNSFISEKKCRTVKYCKYNNCETKSIGSSGLCKKHGGGRRCKKLDCNKASQGRSGFCVSHGGGKRCIFSGCTKLSRGKAQFCIPHGGGNRCENSKCTKLAQGGTKFCIRHGGGKRCKFIDSIYLQGHEEPKLLKCTKSAVSSTNYCVGHGGGKRCKAVTCDKGAVGRTSFCVRHGGGKRCIILNCTKSAVGKSNCCISHGGIR